MPIVPRRKTKTEDEPAAEPAAPEKPAVVKRTTSGRVTAKPGRYTPPLPKEYHRSPTWVPVLMLTLMLLGMIIIISNYFPGAGFLPGDSNNWYLLTGLGLITAGFIIATKWH